MVEGGVICESFKLLISATRDELPPPEQRFFGELLMESQKSTIVDIHYFLSFLLHLYHIFLPVISHSLILLPPAPTEVGLVPYPCDNEPRQ